MRYSVLAVALGFAAQAVNAQPPAYDLPIRPAPARTIVELPGVAIGGILPSTNPNRLYYQLESKVYLFDVRTKRSTVAAEGEFWNLDVSPLNDRFVFHRFSEGEKGSNIWTMPLDPKTGLTAGPARRLALSPGDQPRFSPDGKWIVFSAYDSVGVSDTQHLAVIPVDGGPERVVGPRTNGIGTIRWSPDGRTIHFAAVLHDHPGWRILRVPAAGGGVDTLPVFFGTGFPGLSPDGRIIALRERGGRGNYVITDAHGAPQARFSLPSPLEAEGNWFNPNWLGARSLIATAVRRKNAVRILDLKSGVSRELLSVASEPEAPFLSPDGKWLATFANSRGNRVILVVDVATGARREFVTGLGERPTGTDLAWSPDGKAIAFGGGGLQPFRVLDLGTGTVREISPSGANSARLRWRSDSRALQYTTGAAAVNRRLAETSLDGASRVLHDQMSGPGMRMMISDSMAVFNADSGVFLINVRTHVSKLLRRYSSPSIVKDRKGTVFALRETPSEKREIEIFDASGQRQALLSIPSLPNWRPEFPVPMEFHPDGRIILVGRNGDNQYAVYAADPKGNTSRKLFDLPNRATLPYIDLSADGRFLVYSVEGPPTSVIAEIDLSSFVSEAQTRKP